MKTFILLLAAAVVAVLGTTAAHASVNTPAAHRTAGTERRLEVVRWSDYRRCLYKVSLSGVGAGGFTVHINTDTCHHRMWAVARCGTGRHIYGNVVTNPGRNSTTQGSCGVGNFNLIWWGVRDQQFIARNLLETRLHCLSATRCNN